MPVGRMLLERCAVAQRDQALRNALAPNGRIHLREAHEQVFEYGVRGAVEFRKVEAGCASQHRRSIVVRHSGAIITVRTYRANGPYCKSEESYFSERRPAEGPRQWRPDDRDRDYQNADCGTGAREDFES